MSAQESELDRLRQALDALQAQGAAASPEQARLRRFANALTTTPDEHTRCQEQMAAMAEAELRGERIARLFPEAAAHLDLCESCSFEYAELIDALMELEGAIDNPPAIAAPPLPQRIALVTRLREWVMEGVGPIVEKLTQVDFASFEPALQLFMQRIADLPSLVQPESIRQTANAFGGANDATRVLLATWTTTERIAEQYSARQLAEMAGQGTLVAMVRRMAEESAAIMRLEREQRRQFVEEYLALVQSETNAFIMLGREL